MAAAAACAVLSAAAYAEDTSAAEEDELLRLKELVLEQNRQMDQLEAQLEAQRRRLESLEKAMTPRLQAADYPYSVREPEEVPPGPSQATTGPPDRRYVQAEPGEERAPVGEAPREPREERPPEVPVLFEVGGILTPRGTLVVEPSLQLSHTSRDRFIFRGFELAEVVLIGLIEASESSRDTLIPALTMRYGITNRLEAEFKLPFVFRSDRVTSTLITADPETTLTRTPSAADLGDVEFAAHYQVNRGLDGWPFFIANLRAKSDTGEGPFEIERDALGVETELATGSGFWSVEPSVTVIFPTDPAVFFANAGYVFNIGRSIDKTVGESFIGEVDPGDAVRGSVGMGFAINENSSFSLGYKHDFIFETTTEIDGVDFDSTTLHSGSLFFGLSQRISGRVAVHLIVEGGVTRDAPDATVLFRVPISFGLL